MTRISVTIRRLAAVLLAASSFGWVTFAFVPIPEPSTVGEIASIVALIFGPPTAYVLLGMLARNTALKVLTVAWPPTPWRGVLTWVKPVGLAWYIFILTDQVRVRQEFGAWLRAA